MRCRALSGSMQKFEGRCGASDINIVASTLFQDKLPALIGEKKMSGNHASFTGRVTRRAILAAGLSTISVPAWAQRCEIGPPPHEKGRLVFMNYDQVELDAAYAQERYEPLATRVYNRLGANSAAARARLGEPERLAYGPTEIEKLDVFRTARTNAPIFIFIHGGTWRHNTARDCAYAAEVFIKAGAHFLALDFASVTSVAGDLGVLAIQIRRAITWVYKNAAIFDGDPNRLYIGGHSSGGHLCAVALVTDWQKDFGLPADIVKGGVCMSGMFDLEPVRLSWRRRYISFTDDMVHAMSPQRHLEKLRALVVVTYGTFETPEFQRQSRDFAAAVRTVGKKVELIEALNYHHLEMAETLGNPYGPNGRAALALMDLGPA